MADRRRVNGPPGGTRPPVFASSFPSAESAAPSALERPNRSRKPDELRKIYLKTGLVPSASGSAYLELQPDDIAPFKSRTVIPPSSSLKLSCTVHGPKPLPRSAPFSPNLVLSTHVKFAPFAARRRRGYLRDVSERDLGVHLETALRGIIIGDRWPKSGLDVSITIIEGEDDRWWGDTLSSGPFSGMDGWGLMNILSGCISVASAAIADARVDCLDLIAGGVAAFVKPKETTDSNNGDVKPVLDPNPAEHEEIWSACVVGYMPSRDEIAELWLKGDSPSLSANANGLKDGASHELLIDSGIEAARAVQAVIMEAVQESAERVTHKGPFAESADYEEVQI